MCLFWFWMESAFTHESLLISPLACQTVASLWNWNYFLCVNDNTHHVFENGDLPATVCDGVVTGCLSAVHHCFFGLGSPDVRRPSNTGEQTGGSTHRVVTGPGRLLVPCFDRMAWDEQRDSDAHHGKPNQSLHSWNNLGSFYAAE